MTVAGTQTTAPASAASGGFLTRRQITLVFIGLMLGIFLAALDQMIVSVAIRTIADDLQGLSLQAWVTTAYLITSTISTPLYGKLSDIYGRKQFFLTAISIFIVGSIACTFSTSMYMLAAFRAFQGLGAGGLMALALAIIGDIVPPRERAKYQGYFLAVFGTSSVLGPVVGGFLAGQSEILHIAGWRWVFLVNVPIAAIALAVVAKVLNIPHTRSQRRIDWWGALTITIGLVPLLIIAEQGQQWGWTSLRAWLCYGIGMAGLLLFVAAEHFMREDALIPLRLFRIGVFNISSGAMLIIGMGMFGGLSVIPLYLQIVKSASPTKAGLLTLPLVLGIMVGSVFSGQLVARTGRYKIFPIVGTALMVAGMLLLNTINADTPLWRTDVWMAIFGLGLGNCMQTLITAVQNAVPAKDMGVASSSATFFRQMGATLGTAVFLSILFSVVGSKIASAFQQIVPTPPFQAALHDPTVLANPANAPILSALQGGGLGQASSQVLQDSSFIQQIDARLARPFLVGFSDSMHPVFITGAIVVAVAFFLLLFMKEIPLRLQSGLQAQLNDESAAVVISPDITTQGLENSQLGPVEVEKLAGGMLVRGRIHGPDGDVIAKAALTLVDATGQQVDRSFSDSYGEYHIAAPRPGSYTLVVNAESYQPAAISVVGQGTGEFIHDVRLANGVELHGTARTADGRPIPDARVALLDNAHTVVGMVTTNASGKYSFTNLPAGEYTVIASGYPPATSTINVNGDALSEHDVLLGYTD